MTRSEKNATWWQKATVSTVGAALAGASVGVVLAGLGQTIPAVSREPVGFVLAMIGLLMLSVETVARVRLMPQVNRETEQSLLHRGPLVWAAANGGLLGLGFTSRLGTWLWYVVPVAAIMGDSVIAGALIYGCYGFVRLAIASGFAWYAVARPYIDVMEKIHAHFPVAVRVGDASFAAVAAAALVAMA